MKHKIALSEIEFTPALFNRLCSEDVELFITPDHEKRISQNYLYLMDQMQNGKKIYGINTGFGKNVSNVITGASKELQENLALYLDCAQGDYLPSKLSRIIFLQRTRQASGPGTAVSLEAIKHLVTLFNLDVAPVIPTLGSLGASGDLVTMAPMARLLFDENVECWHKGEMTSLKEVLRYHNINLPGVRGRDSLGIMNGLAVAATFAMDELVKTAHLFNVSLQSIALCKAALGANFSSESETINSRPVRCFEGQEQIAETFRSIYEGSIIKQAGQYHQDAYSLRCLSQFLGPVLETTKLSFDWICRELNSQSDNPFIGDNLIVNGGNFYGGYLTQSADLMAVNVARVAELLDRQTFHLVGGKYGLPENLIEQNKVGNYHGLKGIHQLSNSLLMKIQPQAVSYALATRSSEMHNQDVVSNCMNAWVRIRDMREDFERILSCHLTLSAQASDLSVNQSPALSYLVKDVRRSVPFVKKDISLRAGLEDLRKRISEITCQGPFIP